MDAGTITLDRRLPDPEEVRGAFEATDQTWCDGHDELTSLVRLLYPVFRVEYSYVAEGPFPWSSTERNLDTCLVDGLRADNSTELTTYADDVLSPTTVHPETRFASEDTRTQLLEFQVTNGQVATILENYFSTQLAAGDNNEMVAHSSVVPPARKLDLLNDEDNSFGSFGEISRIYLPFWLAKLESEFQEYPCYIAVRDLDGPGDKPIDTHPWLATFATDHPELLTEYSREDWLSTPEETASASGVEHEDRKPTEPEDSTLSVEEVLDTNPERCFDDVAGMEDLKGRLDHRVLEPYRHPEKFEDYGLSTVDGVLLYGPPGCGKTYISGALAGELDHEFIRVTPADITSRYMGEPAQRVADLFEIARMNQPCLVFIDEIDALAGERTDDGMNASERQVVNQLLTELESVADEDVMVLAATNRIEDIDSAIRRSGRFDERIEVPPPDAPARRAMLDLHLGGRPTGDIDLDGLVAETAGYAASDIELIVESGARQALREDSEIRTEHLRAALAETETSIAGWTDSYPGLFDSEPTGRPITQPGGVAMDASAVVTPNPSRDFSDVGGYDELTAKLESAVLEPIENAEAYAEYDLDATDGILLYGPPGCGKTYVTKALAGELGYHFLPLSSADISNEWLGRPTENIADLIEIARANQPCLVFLDDINAIAGDNQAVNQLLAEVAALEDQDVVVVAATNLLEDVDPSIRRAGQFEEQLEVLPPDAETRKGILATHLQERPTADDIDWQPAVEATAGFAGSDLTLVAEDAARRAFRDDEPVDGSHLEAAAEDAVSSLAEWSDRDRYEDEQDTSSLRYFG